MAHRVVVIEDEGIPAVASVHVSLARDPAFACRRLSWDDVVPSALATMDEQLVIAVAVPPTPKIVSVFEALAESGLKTPILAVVPPDAEESVLRVALRAADDFIFPPIRPIELRHRLGRVLAEPHDDAERVRQRIFQEVALARLVGKDAAFVRAVEPLPRFARAELPVLITGETGTGKELCARAIHHLGRRRAFPFVAVDCGAIPDQLFENEVFGHARGAFTDAHRDRKGLVAIAEGGTLFLDEVDALSLAGQAKLLRFLQERTFRALGSDTLVRADVRVVAATNRDLEACVREKRFRADLYFRLNVLRVRLPPLRERRADIELLAYDVVREWDASGKGVSKVLSPAAVRMLTAYDWPGNVRELTNVVQRAVVACDGPAILASHLVFDTAPDVAASAAGHFRAARAAALEAFERRYVEDLLRKHAGNVTHAAREAQQERRAFGRFIKKYRIDKRAL